MKKNSKNLSTVEPVQLDGWYELQDGRVARFVWCSCKLSRRQIVASWADVPEPPSHPGYDVEIANAEPTQ